VKRCVYRLHNSLERDKPVCVVNIVLLSLLTNFTLEQTGTP
jgi:hypothetical protein